METKKTSIRTLEASEIEVRVQSVKKTEVSCGAILLLYKDARCDMSILDETFGITGWKRRHEFKNNQNYCTVSIWDYEKKEWIDKEDIGVESYTEKEKGQASDAFKRACVNIGIGRELYTSPFIWVSLSDGEFYSNGKGGFALSPKVKFSVKTISYDDKRNIVSLAITDQNNRERFCMGKKVDAPAVSQQQQPAQPRKIQYVPSHLNDGEWTGKICRWLEQAEHAQGAKFHAYNMIERNFSGAQSDDIQKIISKYEEYKAGKASKPQSAA